MRREIPGKLGMRALALLTGGPKKKPHEPQAAVDDKTKQKPAGKAPKG